MTHFQRLLLLGCLSYSLGCDDAPATSNAGAKAGTKAASSADAKSAGKAGSLAPPPVDFQDVDFIESERGRDPFRSFAKFFVDTGAESPTSQRDVVVKDYSLDELKLVGIVTNIRPARAMLVDPTGRGHVVTRGQFVGKAEVVRGAANTTDYEINWRVEHVRADDIVLIREDPSNPGVPTATRVIPLRPDEPVARR